MNSHRSITAAALVLSLAGCTDGDPAGDAAGTPEASPSQAVSSAPQWETLPDGDEGPTVDAGTYLAPEGINGSGLPAYTLTLPDGWTVEAGDFKKNEDTARVMALSWWALDDLGIFEDACFGEPVFAEPPSAGPEGLVSALQSQKSGPVVRESVATTLGGLPAIEIRLDYPDRLAKADCRIGPGQLQIWDGYFIFFPNGTASIHVVDIAGTSHLLLAEAGERASAADRAELQSIVGSISFEVGE